MLYNILYKIMLYLTKLINYTQLEKKCFEENNESIY